MVPSCSSRIWKCGTVFLHLLEEQGASIIAVSDSKGAISNKDGIKVSSIRKHKEDSGSVVDYASSKSITTEELLETECTILVPAALENQINKNNASKIKAKIVAEAANGPTLPEADEIFFKNNIMVIPDILANGGGVTVSYFEWLQNLRRDYWTEEEVNNRLDANMTTAFADVYATHQKHNVDMRKASMVVAIDRVVEAINIRGLWP